MVEELLLACFREIREQGGEDEQRDGANGPHRRVGSHARWFGSRAGLKCRRVMCLGAFVLRAEVS